MPKGHDQTLPVYDELTRHHSSAPFTASRDKDPVKLSSQYHKGYIPVKPSSQLCAEYALVEVLTKFRTKHVKASLKDAHGECIAVEAPPSGTMHADARDLQTEIASEGGVIFL